MLNELCARFMRAPWRSVLAASIVVAVLVCGAAIALWTRLVNGDLRQAGVAPSETAAPTPLAPDPAAATTPPQPAAPASPPPEPLPPPPPPPMRVRALFDTAGAAYPPARVVLAAFKEERQLYLYARSRKSQWRLVHRYPILGASGAPGPKLLEGDRQVPEGVYAIESLHPKSKYHLALRLDYPNAFDREMGAADKRANLGGDIMIHGGSGSIGCLAMGDPAIEELYEIAATTKLRNVKVVIAPFDMRAKPSANLPTTPPWAATLYKAISDELGALPAPPAS